MHQNIINKRISFFLHQILMDNKREVNVFMAKVCQECNQNEQCIQYMTEVINQDRPLSFNERNLLSAAYKGIVSPLRDSIRLLQDDSHGYNVTDAIIECSKELSRVCDEVINLINTKLLLAVTEPEVRVFYIKMIADYYRYKWEATSDAQRPAVASDCKKAYQEAASLADTSLPAYHPLRLGLALNFSVFLYEVLGQTSRAIELASKAYNDSGSGIEQLSAESKGEALHTLQLLDENIKAWQRY